MSLRMYLLYPSYVWEKNLPATQGALKISVKGFSPHTFYWFWSAGIVKDSRHAGSLLGASIG